jgi:hypothetical protein
MSLIIDANSKAPGKEPFTKTNLWITGLTSGVNGDGIRGMLVRRMYSAWTQKPPEKRKKIPTKKVNEQLPYFIFLLFFRSLQFTTLVFALLNSKLSC